MADYYPLVAAAIAGLVKNTREGRWALYDRARTSLVAQLRGMNDPPLTEAEITRERLALEEAIRKVEAEAARRVNPAIPSTPAQPVQPRPAGERRSVTDEGLKGFYEIFAEAANLAQAGKAARRAPTNADPTRAAMLAIQKALNLRDGRPLPVRPAQAPGGAPSAWRTTTQILAAAPSSTKQKKLDANVAKPFIFVSYRRADSPGTTVMICEKLVDRFGSDSVFLDIESIPPGRNFRKHIADAVEKADVMLVLIGPQWLAKDEHGLFRIASENDFVRIEIEYALRRNVPIIPVLLDGAPIPHPKVLPPSVQPLLDQQAVTIQALYERDRGIQRLIAGIDGILKSSM